MTGWQPIETAPKDGTEILAWVPDCLMGSGGCVHVVSVDVFEDGDAFTDEYGNEVNGITHWMPLPEPPTPAKSEGATA